MDKCRQIAFWGFVYGLDIRSKQLARPRRRQPLEAERERMSAEEGRLVVAARKDGCTVRSYLARIEFHMR